METINHAKRELTLRHEEFKRICAVLSAAIEGGSTVETIKPSEIFICGPNSHNHISGAYRSSRTGRIHPYHECAVRDNHAGWIERLCVALHEVGWDAVEVEVEYNPQCCWVSGGDYMFTGTARIYNEENGYRAGVTVGWNVPLPSETAEEIQKRMPVGWVAKKSWWEKQK